MITGLGHMTKSRKIEGSKYPMVEIPEVISPNGRNTGSLNVEWSKYQNTKMLKAKIPNGGSKSSV
ncbi:hypothetical protein M514_22944 [Trichuris suis]|uniref:Uncharacterized protein n=1 Tax=Trichuris suis TaxID=68888 RepID=A0A085N620_9BILA|nr:hypothetical protein M514_22944 [Trichuris suis]